MNALLEANLSTNTDSYKLTHWNMLMPDTEQVYSYWEAREGAKFPNTLFFGLQYYLKEYLVGNVISEDDVKEAFDISQAHLGEKKFNYRGWLDLINKYQGRLPVRIKAIPEGTIVPVSNVMMTIENTDPEFPWLTNYLETLLCRLWYSSTVATLSHHVIERIGQYLDATADNRDALPFMLHDFGARGTTSTESAAIGGAAHLVCSRGTDTVEALRLAHKYYDAPYDTLGFSVAATEHSVMTALGREGEMKVVDHLLNEFPDGILSMVADSYDIYNFVAQIGTQFRERVLARDGVVVIRPDSKTPEHKTPEQLMVKLSQDLWHFFGGTTNSKGYKVLDPHVRLLWGDGIGPAGIDAILKACMKVGFSAENYVFGMGGGLLQKMNRDTQRFAFKCSAQYRDGKWADVQKNPLDATKLSKAGRLSLVRMNGGVKTVPFVEDGTDLLETVFENGELIKEYTFDEVRANGGEK